MANELDNMIAKQKADGTYYAPSVAARVAASAPSLSEPIPEPDIKAFGQPGGKAFQQAATYNLNDRKFQFDEEHKRLQESISQLKAADDHTNAALSAVKDRLALENQVRQKADTIDFLRKFSGVKHTDPDYEEKVGVIAALHPLAGNDPMVKEMLATQHQARQVYTDVMKEGGVNQFDGPAREAYMSIANKTGGDIIQAHAAAKRVQEADNQLMKDREEGYIKDEDIQHPNAVNEDGSLNYRHLREVAVKAKGEKAGKVAQAEDADEKRDLMLIEKFGADRTALRDGDARKPVLENALLRQAQRDAARSPKPQTTASPSGSPSPSVSPTKRYTDGF